MPFTLSPIFGLLSFLINLKDTYFPLALSDFFEASGDKSFYVKVVVRKTHKVAILPFTDFINDFTRQINTQPVVSWAVKRP